MTSFFSLNSSLRQQPPPPNSMDPDPSSTLNGPITHSFYHPQNQSRNGQTGRGRNHRGPTHDSTLPIPAGVMAKAGGSERNGNGLGGIPPFEIARSPPGNKNTKHVPCKFFMQGTCQAGNACPFSHTMDPHTQNAPCKYFMKGNCKFGAKCALAHYMPDGRRINRSDLEYGMGTNGRQSFGRVESSMYPSQDSALANSLLAQQQFQPPDMFPPQYPYGELDESDAYADRRYAQPYQMTPLSAALNSPPGSHFGSPPDDFHLPRSPVEHLRTALNAPLPQSFDSNGVSNIARYGPLGQSLPDKFGLKSPSTSVPRKGVNPAEPMAVRSGSKLASPLASSPQNQDDSIGARVVAAQPFSQNRGIPSSVPKSSRIEEWDSLDADLLPNSLHDEVLTPEEKMHRLSRPDPDATISSKDRSGALAIPGGPATKVGSAPAAGSPSRFRALWEEQREKKTTTPDPNTSTSTVSAFGHVGSPLRESWMPNTSNPSAAVTSTSPRYQSTNMSAISQQISRMKLESSEASSQRSTTTLRNPSNTLYDSTRPHPSSRTISSPRILALQGTKKPDPDDPEAAFFFPMDSDDASKRSWSGRSPGLDPVRDSFEAERERGKENRPL